MKPLLGTAVGAGWAQCGSRGLVFHAPVPVFLGSGATCHISGLRQVLDPESRGQALGAGAGRRHSAGSVITAKLRKG